MKERVFRFKQFEISHSRSAMKVGVDSVLLGSWADIDEAETILDAGCGCGLLAIMCAQRNKKASICGIEIEKDAAEEAEINVSKCDWSDRLRIICDDYLSHLRSIESKYDVLISNPPYFESGVHEAGDKRMLSRHAMTLSPEIILRHWREAIRPEGKIIMIYPFEHHERLSRIGRECGIYPVKSLKIKGNPRGKTKRILCQFCPKPSEEISETLMIQTAEGDYDEQYRNLTSPFYLKF